MAIMILYVVSILSYCLDTHNSLKLDAKIVRIQERFISDDTCCSWTQKTNQTTKQRSTCERKQNVVTCDGKNIKIARNKERELQNDKPGKKVRSHIPKEPKKKKKFVSKPKGKFYSWFAPVICQAFCNTILS